MQVSDVRSVKKYRTRQRLLLQRISSVEDADKIIVMDNGEINGIGTHEELFEEQRNI